MADTILDVRDVTKVFREGGGRQLTALSHVTLTVRKGETVALVGESGCGKSTLARIITGLLAPDSGSVHVCGKNLSLLKGHELRKAYQSLKMIFQDPRSSFDPLLTIGGSLDEALKAIKIPRSKRQDEASRLLGEVGLDSHFLKLYPHEISGGECQRAALARALTQKPQLLICDEATSALDVSVQAEIVSLLRRLNREDELSILFISHDLALVSQLCSRIFVMHKGEIVEEGTTNHLLTAPTHPYTVSLLSSALSF